MISGRRSLCGLLDRLVEETEGETVTVRDLLEIVGLRAFGPIIVILGFVAISPLTIIPGATWVMALITLIFTSQIVAGFDRPWIPDRLLNFTLKRSHLIAGVEGIRSWAKVFDKLLQPRLLFLTRKPFIRLIALMCVGASLVTFPLGFVPLAPILPGLTILIFGLGLMARDGVVILLALASLLGAMLLLERLAERWLGLNLFWGG